MTRILYLLSILLLIFCSDSSNNSNQVELNGTAWLLDRIVYPNGDQINIRNSLEYKVSFSNQVNVIADCNDCSGEYTVSSNRITIDIGCTEKACPAPSNGDIFSLILKNSYSFQQNQQSLIIYSRNDEQLIFFKGE